MYRYFNRLYSVYNDLINKLIKCSFNIIKRRKTRIRAFKWHFIDIDSFNMDHNEKIKYESYDVNIKSLIDAFNSKHNTTADMVSIITHYNGII